MRVLIADKLPDAARTRLQANGVQVHSDPALKGDTLLAALAEHDPDVLVVRSTKVTAAHLAASRRLQLVVRAGAGVNTIDLIAASARAVCVSNCPGMNADAVAELTFGHIINADRRIADNVADLRDGQWRKKVFSKAGGGLKGRTLGIIGCGDIGRSVIRRAHGFEMDVIGWSRSLDDAAAKALGVRRYDTAIDVARRADVLTVHLALTPATQGFVGDAILQALRPGAIFVNTSRGEVVDEAALLRAIEQRDLRVGLDVFCDEPAADGAWRSTLADRAEVYGTHHIGASTAQAQEAVADEACRVVLTFAATGRAPNCVNLAAKTPATHLLVVRHADQVGVLAGLLEHLREAGINVQQMQNVIFSGEDGAACARIQMEGDPTDDVLEKLRTAPAIFDVQVVELT